jgi:hypothetical protein
VENAPQALRRVPEGRTSHEHQGQPLVAGGRDESTSCLSRRATPRATLRVFALNLTPPACRPFARPATSSGMVRWWTPHPTGHLRPLPAAVPAVSSSPSCRT